VESEWRGGATPPEPLLYLIDTPTPKKLGILVKILLNQLQKSLVKFALKYMYLEDFNGNKR
jgi:hypothetical protein